MPWHFHNQQPTGSVWLHENWGCFCPALHFFGLSIKSFRDVSGRTVIPSISELPPLRKLLPSICSLAGAILQCRYEHRLERHIP